MDPARHDRDALSRTQRWAWLSGEDQRREAIRLANERDLVGLWGLTEAFWVLHGRAS